MEIMSMSSNGAELNHKEILRYSRHLLMPEVGLEGQAKLKDSSVLIIGTGGLGSPVAMYLAAAGVGRIGLVAGRPLLTCTISLATNIIESAITDSTGACDT